MTSMLKKPLTPLEISKHEDRVDLLIRAGEFTQAVEVIMTQHLIDETTVEGSHLNNRTIGGLLGALKFVGSALLELAEDTGEELEAVKREMEL